MNTTTRQALLNEILAIKQIIKLNGGNQAYNNEMYADLLKVMEAQYLSFSMIEYNI